jgi:hypothetical protein
MQLNHADKNASLGHQETNKELNSYRVTPRNIPEQRRFHQHCGGSLQLK